MFNNKIISNIPVFIVVRGNTERTIKKYKEALKFSDFFIVDQDILERTFIISDNIDLLDYSLKLGFKNTIHYECSNEEELYYLEYKAIYKFAIENNYWPDWFILLNPNQLFKDKHIISDCISNINNNYDIIASYTEITDKTKFNVDNINNVGSNEILLTSKYEKLCFVDACIYAIKSSFAYECMKSKEPSKEFWKGKIKIFKNKSLYSDIYDYSDIEKYYLLIDFLSKIKNYHI